METIDKMETIDEINFDDTINDILNFDWERFKRENFFQLTINAEPYDEDKIINPEEKIKYNKRLKKIDAYNKSLVRNQKSFLRFIKQYKKLILQTTH